MIGLPSLRALDGSQAARIWLSAEATDMRCGFDRLAERVRVVIGQDPLGGHLFFQKRKLWPWTNPVKATLTGSASLRP